MIDKSFITREDYSAVKRKLHKTNGPMIVWPNGSWVWWLHDKRHRYYGPQSNTNNTTYDWFIHDERIK